MLQHPGGAAVSDTDPNSRWRKMSMAIRDQHDGRMDAAADRERPREVANESRAPGAGSGSARSRGGRSNRGFASMDPNKQREIASKGGRAAHAKGTAHEFNSDEARDAGRKGGQAVSRNREHMAAIGRRGGEARGNARRQASAQGGNPGGNRTPRAGGGQSAGLGDREVSIGGAGGAGGQGAAASGTTDTASGNSLGGERRGGTAEGSRGESVERP
jgi:general stress protein YciG